MKATLLLLGLLLSASLVFGQTPQGTPDELDSILNQISAQVKGKPSPTPAKAASPTPTPAKAPASPKKEEPSKANPSPTPEPAQAPAAPIASPEIPVPTPPPSVDNSVVEQIKSPKESDGLEETTIYVMRNFMVKKEGTEWEPMRIPVPVYYRTRSVAWNQDQIAKALNLQQRIEEYTKKLDTVKQEGNMLLTEYYNLLTEGFPQQVLTADSPSLPESKQKTIDNPLKSEGIRIKVMPEESKKPSPTPSPTPEPKAKKK